MIIADTSGLLVFFNVDEPAHDVVERAVMTENDALVVSAAVVTELDYLVSTRYGVSVELSVLHELAGGAFDIAWLEQHELVTATEVIERYADQRIGLADASLVVLAARHRTRRILTLDRRHFEVLRPLDGGRFRLVP